MSFSPISYVLSLLLGVNVAFQAVPVFIAFIYKEYELIPSLFLSMAVSLVLALLLMLSGLRIILGEKEPKITHKESFFIVVAAWVTLALMGALPYYFSEAIPLFTDAFFESISGYTTTGASILTNIEALPKSLLFWRSFTHWLGGMGIVVFTLALLPALGVGGMEMYRAEVPGPVPDKIVPRIKQTALILWKVYLALTIILVFLLWDSGMGLFDAVNHAFATLATGGFSTKNDSLAGFSPLVQWITAIFMIIAGTNFALHFRFFQRDWRSYWRDTEFKFYLVTVLLGTLLMTLFLYFMQGSGGGDGFFTYMRHALFQASAIITSTGFASYDYESWPYFAQVVLFTFMFFGGSSGSTGGGIKQMRVLILLKIALDEIRRLVHPRGIYTPTIGNQSVSLEVQKMIFGFTFLYILFLGLGTLLISLWGIDLLTSLTAALASLGNIGPGFGDIGPTDNYAWFPAPVKWLLSFLMLLGRLEIFPLLVLLAPGTWRR